LEREAAARLHIKSLFQSLAGGLIVSCQAPDADPFRDPASMARFAQAAGRGGAIGLRVNGAPDVAAVRQAVSLPVIGIQKRTQPDGKVLITLSFEDARELVTAGAQIVAVECTARALAFGALDLIRRIRAELNVPVMADIATLEEAIAAEEAGVDLVASTMRGYTEETKHIRLFQPEFIAALVTVLKIPVLAEGRVDTPEQAAEALRAGAHAVIVGTAITRPEVITARFAAALSAGKALRDEATVVGIDLGGTNTKAAILSPDGLLACRWPRCAAAAFARSVHAQANGGAAGRNSGKGAWDRDRRVGGPASRRDRLRHGKSSRMDRHTPGRRTRTRFETSGSY
jgi:putative N-acetylmannosamine-6-phosphate epimerase